MTDINLIADNLSKVIINNSSMEQTYYNMFYNPNPLDIVIELYNEEGILQSYTVPNVAKSNKQCYTGVGSPNGSVYANRGAFYLDTNNNNVYIKTTDESSSGWNQMTSMSDLITHNSDISVHSILARTTYVNSFLPMNYLTGLTLSNTTADLNNSITVSVGSCKDISNVESIHLSSVLSKKLNANFSAGNDNGGLDTGTKTVSTWYHCFVISKADGTTDCLFSLSVNNPTMPTNYIYKRRIGSIKTDSSGNILKFTQFNNNFIWNEHVLDISDAALGTTAKLYTMSVPTGLSVLAIVNFTTYAGGAVLITSPYQNDTAVVAGTMSHMSTGVSYQVNYSAQILTNNSGQIRGRANAAATQLYGLTSGYVDMRGCV